MIYSTISQLYLPLSYILNKLSLGWPSEINEIHTHRHTQTHTHAHVYYTHLSKL